jgi:DNA-dependent protein kinase catalytic subunit
MRFGSALARQRFPRLLQLLAGAGAAKVQLTDIFVVLAARVPSWMFIAWIPQLIAVVDKPELRAVQNILSTLAEVYPQALAYAVMISNEMLRKPGAVLPPAADAFLRDLERRLLTPLQLDLVRALNMLTNPDHLLQAWCEDVIPEQLNANNRDVGAIKALFAQLSVELLESGAGSGSRRTASTSTAAAAAATTGAAGRTQPLRYGTVGRAFAERNTKEIAAAFGADGGKLVGMSVKDFHKVYAGLRGKIVAGPAVSGPGKLDDYSPWLAGFQANAFSTTLEVCVVFMCAFFSIFDTGQVPGQYNGTSKPQPEFHARVQSFDERVLILSSIRKPKRIIMRGHNEKDYPFLVKGGEDLRQDQRIEQLFGVMNEILAGNTECAQRQLALRRLV